jgi:hypothetical protein
MGTALQKKRFESELNEERQNKDINQFWYSIIVNNEIKWKIDHLKLSNFIRSKGYRRYDIGKDYIFIKIVDRVIDEVTVTHMQDMIMDYIDNLSYDSEWEHESGITRDELLSKFYTSPAIYFNNRKQSTLGIEPDLTMNSDTKENSFIYYSNGFVKCSSDGFQIYPYKKLKGHIFKNQIKQRAFEKHSSEGMFRQFVFNISGKNEQRFLAFQTMIGYLLHGYFETKMKAVNLTDSSISDVAEGRTGKSLFGKAIAQIKNVCEINGKDFDPSNKHKYATASIDTQIIFLNDLQKRFNFERLFNDISEAITVDRKNLQPFQVRTKMIIAANDTFRIEGASAKDRVIEFELSEHYGADYSPENEFGCWFFTDWDKNEWLSFDNFMMECITSYLAKGIIEAEQINLDKRKQMQHTNRDFVEFMEEKIEAGEIRNGIDYSKTELHNEFLENYPEYKDDRWMKRTSNFTRYLKSYVSYSQALGKPKERKSNGTSFIKFTKIEDETLDIPF